MSNVSPDSQKRAAAERICATLREAGFRALLAGGCVRDILLGIQPHDYDIATSARPQQVAALFDKVVPVGAAFGVQKVACPEGFFEVATFRTDGPYSDGRHPDFVNFSDEMGDAARRDFTINAMFLDPQTDRILDYFNGQEDLRRGVIRCVGDPERRFQEDYLRMLRAVRFAARFGFEIDSFTFQAIKKYASLITRTSVERIRDEVTKILTQGNVCCALELLDETTLLREILPEVDALKGVTQPEEFHPEGDVFRHTTLTMDMLKNPTVTLAFGALLHDVGKPQTRTETDRIRFNNHDKVGAAIAESVCQRLRLSNAETERVVWLVKNHMKLAHAPCMKKNRLKRFVRQEGFTELLALGEADCLASHKSLEIIEWLKNYLAEQQPEELNPAPLLSGDDLIEMGFQPGPAFREILNALEDAQLDGKINTKEEAKTFVLQNWSDPHSRKQTD